MHTAAIARNRHRSPTRVRAFVRASIPAHFPARVAAVAAAGLALRVAYLLVSRSAVLDGDGTYYHSVAGMLADGFGFIEPNQLASSGRRIPWAPHMPLWPGILAFAAKAGIRSLLQQQILAALLGAATVAATACAARRVANERAGLIAAALTAATPTLFLYEWELVSEVPVQLLAALVLLAAYRYSDRPATSRALLLGLLCGLLTLTRSEQALLVPFLLAPLVLRSPGLSLRRRLGMLGAAVGLAALLILPWSLYISSQFARFVPLSTQLGPTMVEANCDSTYGGARLGFADGECRKQSTNNPIPPGGDASTRDAAMREEAFHYIGDHLGRLPLVVVAREGRAWGAFRPWQQMRFDASRGTRLSVVRAGYLVYWALVPLAAVGALLLRRRRVALAPILALPLTVTVAVAITFGSPRYRAPAEVALIVLAAVALDGGLARRASRAGPSTQSL